MLGGSVYVALIRFMVSLMGVIILYTQMGGSRFGRRETILYYGGFSTVLLTAACFWYVIDRDGCVRMVAFVMYMCFSVFALFLDRGHIGLSVYKLSLTFYLSAGFLISGIGVSMLFFGGDVWVDILVRILLIAVMAFFLERKIKASIRGFGNYMENGIDHIIRDRFYHGSKHGRTSVLPAFSDRREFFPYWYPANFSVLALPTGGAGEGI